MMKSDAVFKRIQRVGNASLSATLKRRLSVLGSIYSLPKLVTFPKCRRNA